MSEPPKDPAAAGMTAHLHRRRAEAQAELLSVMKQSIKIDLQAEYDPGSSTPAELEERIRDLAYRLKWLEAVLSVTNDELLSCQLALKAAEQAEAGRK